jgi:hypothetical protein
MSDTPQGPDWWQASDDKWYPPPRPQMPGDAGAGSPSATPGGGPSDLGFAPPGGPPAGPPLGPPTGPPTGVPGGAYPPAGTPSGGFPPGGAPGAYPPGAAPSPYGGMPAGPPGQPGTNRTPLFVALGVVVAAAIIGLIVVMSGDDDNTADPDRTVDRSDTTLPDDSTDTTGAPSDEPGDEPSDEPSGSGQIEVVETGFSNYKDSYDEEIVASYGFVLENKGDETIASTEVNVALYDASDTVIASDSHTVFVLRPGEKVGVGDELWGELTAEVARIEVVPGPSPYPADVPDEGTLTAEGINTVDEEYGGLKTTFTIASTYAEQVDSPNVYAIYRDAGGAIIGGARGYMDFVPAGGKTAAEITTFEVIPNVATTEVYADPSFF